MYDLKEINVIKDYMLRSNQTVSVAESVTSGHIQAALSRAEFAMKFFQGGITAYNLGQKYRHLQVEPIHAQFTNCVSERVAMEMADNVCSLFRSDWGIGITGYAMPAPEVSVEEPFAFFSFSFRGKNLEVKKIHTTIKDAWEVQKFFTEEVIKEFASLIV
ncbi:CinA family protein [Ohtaekwangia koreensis]|uniref:Amidohydrolase, PncC family n=1 Tax=Ohtaekwangia koreensis TaxID=688867 RepID=A0A1T5IPT0_9BACT|nr:CinA family protein [Ohtaekwangia koreensis]SKC41166.1 amidohydrolase, PncC family [Ohtaekwangia koreensis]